MSIPLMLLLAAPLTLRVARAHEDPPSDDGIAWGDEDTKKKKTDKKEEEEKDEDDFSGEEPDLGVFKEGYGDEDEDQGTKRIEEGDTLEGQDKDEEKDDEDYGGDQEDKDLDFHDDEDKDIPIGGPGQDTARIYRDQIDKMDDLGPDEEIITWERYLETYPNSLFKDRIQARIEELNSSLYDERVAGSDGFGEVDAGRREIGFATPMFIDPVDPRDKLRLGFEWGYPQYLNLIADYEQQIQREWSWHVGMQHRYPGWDFTFGTRYALVKSARTNFLLTVTADPHFNMNPFFFGFRPILAAGKRFEIKGNPLDLQAQAGVDLEVMSPFTVRYQGGAALNYHASDKVSFFLETNLHMKNLMWEEGGSFRFNTVGFGISFNVDKDKVAGLAASSPYTTNYWGYHYGSIMGDFNYYM